MSEKINSRSVSNLQLLYVQAPYTMSWCPYTWYDHLLVVN